MFPVQTTNDTVRIRQAGPEDADAVARLMITSMRQDRGWGMDRAVRDGVVVTLLASPMGRGVYPRFGFEELGTITAQVKGEEEKTHLYAMAWGPKTHA